MPLLDIEFSEEPGAAAYELWYHYQDGIVRAWREGDWFRVPATWEWT